MTATATPVLRVTRSRSNRTSPKVDTKARAMVSRQPRLALILTIVMGVGIPLLSLSLSTIAGRLALAGHLYLAGGGLLLCGSVLAVSLSHLAWSVSDITRSGAWASWALAATIDLAIVLCESVQVFAPDAGLDVLATTVMVAVTVSSMACNVWAFLRHR